MRSVVVLPTYNERDNLKPIVQSILGSLPETRVLVVDDNSPDGTGELADTLSKETSGQVQVLHRTEKEGLGRAYLAGFRHALAWDIDHVIQMDADFSHPTEVLPTFIAALKEYDFVLGSRYIKGGGTRNWDFKRRLLSRGGNIYAQLILQSKIRDLTGGFKAYNRRVLEYLVNCPINSHGYHFQIEMTYRAVKAGFTYKEVPFIFSERQQGVSKMSQGIIWEALLNTIRLRQSIKSQSRESLNPA